MRETLQRRIDAAQGRIPVDLIIQDVEYLDVFHAKWRRGDVAVVDGTIVGLESGLKGARTIGGQGKRLVPGFIDAHVHVESSLLEPSYFEEAVLACGTTTAVCDPHELANVLGVSGIEYFLKSSENLSMDLWVMLSSCVPATHMETNGGGVVTAADLAPLKGHSKALGLAEMMNMPGVLSGDEEVLNKLESFGEMPMDGHSPLLRGRELSAYASVGISSCHESSEIDEAAEKLTKGMKVWIREGSVAKDLNELIPLLNLATSSSMGFCTDDRNPYDIAEQGHIDFLLREAIRQGVAEEVVYRAASWSVAQHYGLNRGWKRVGAIAPGYQGDFVLLDESRSCSVHSVFKAGVPTTELPRSARVEAEGENSIRADLPEESDLKGPEGQVHVIDVIPGKIITGRSVAPSEEKGVSRLSVLERYGKGLPPANAYVRGFGQLKGAIASSVGHDSHNLIVVGGDLSSMRTALGSLIESGGGFCVVEAGGGLTRLALPFGGLMSRKSPDQLKEEISVLKAASRRIGCELEEPFLQLAFLSLPVIPSLKLTDRGLVDVEKFQLIDVRA